MLYFLFGLWTQEITFVDLNIRFSVKFPPRGLILRSQFWTANVNSMHLQLGPWNSGNFNNEINESMQIRLPTANISNT